MYLTIKDEVITGIYCGNKQDGFIEVPNTFNGSVGYSINDFDEEWNLLPKEPEPVVEPEIPEGYKLVNNNLIEMTLIEKIEVGLEALPEGYEIKDNQLVQVITPEMLREQEIYSLMSYLDSTDWYSIRLLETGVAIPTEILEQRALTRIKISELRTI